MTKDEHTQILNDIKNATTDADRMNLIVKLEQDYTGILAERDTAVVNANKATEECNKYAKLNNELWLTNSAQHKAGQAIEIDNNGAGAGTEVDPPVKRTYEDLENKFD